jgi:hypothetical protein
MPFFSIDVFIHLAKTNKEINNKFSSTSTPEQNCFALFGARQQESRGLILTLQDVAGKLTADYPKKGEIVLSRSSVKTLFFIHALSRHYKCKHLPSQREEIYCISS